MVGVFIEWGRLCWYNIFGFGFLFLAAPEFGKYYGQDTGSCKGKITFWMRKVNRATKSVVAMSERGEGMKAASRAIMEVKVTGESVAEILAALKRGKAQPVV